MHLQIINPMTIAIETSGKLPFRNSVPYRHPFLIIKVDIRGKPEEYSIIFQNIRAGIRVFVHLLSHQRQLLPITYQIRVLLCTGATGKRFSHLSAPLRNDHSLLLRFATPFLHIHTTVETDAQVARIQVYRKRILLTDLQHDITPILRQLRFIRFTDHIQRHLRTHPHVRNDISHKATAAFVRQPYIHLILYVRRPLFTIACHHSRRL